MLTLASAGVILASLWSFVQPREYTAQSSAIVFAGSSSNVGEGQAQMAFTREGHAMPNARPVSTRRR
jgi:uncharacterized protein involved in exopolysaccharide biosynthesis